MSDAGPFPFYDLAYDYEPASSTRRGYAEVYHSRHGVTLFYCISDAIAERLCRILSGDP